MSDAQSKPDTTALTPLLSDFAGDEDMMELVDFFVNELHERVKKITTAWENGETNTLRSLSHQLKGAGGGYGYPSITESASTLEAAILSGEGESSDLEEMVEGLVILCKRAIEGSKGS